VAEVTVRDKLLAILVPLLVGLNFVAARIGLDHFPPLFLAGLRFLVLVLPVVLFVPRPNVPLRWLLIYGVTFGILQFGLLFLAINTGMPAGLSSLVIQSAAPFTVVLGVLLLGERVTPRQAGGVGLASLGIAVIAWDHGQLVTLVPLVLTLMAALAAALGNLASRQARPDSPLGFALWMSLVPPVPLLALSAVLEGPTTGWVALRHSFTPEGWPGLVALVYVVLSGTVAGAAIWIALLKRHPASAIAPFSMLVPVVGILAAWVVLGEQPTLVALVGGVGVMLGVWLGTPRLVPVQPEPQVGALTRR
jgi:drug/metabolite transporter (DMT)-like permease